MSEIVVEVKNLFKRFKDTSGNEISALKNINFNISNGEIYGIIGSSGAGKSTLIRCLTGLEKACEGKVLIHGQDVAELNSVSLAKLRQNLGMVFQHFHLFSSRTVAGNIAYAMEIRGASQKEQEERVEELLHLVGLSHKKNAFPAHLSGGEKQRVGIARALANSPSILLCDEATSALDPQTTRSILQLLQQLNQKLGLTIVVITHQLEAVKQICTQMAVISKGEIVEKGKVIEMFTKPQQSHTRDLIHGPIEHLLSDWVIDTARKNYRLIRLLFEGGSTKTPLISRMVKLFNVEVNILLGGVDWIQNTLIGNLLIEISGQEENIIGALDFLKIQNVSYEEF